MKTNKQIWQELKIKTNELIEVIGKNGLLSSNEINLIDKDKFFYSNGNDSTEFDIKANGRLCEIGVLYKGTENSAIQLNIYEDGGVYFSTFDKNGREKVTIGDFSILDDEEFRKFATTIHNEMDSKNKFDTYLDDNMFTDDEVEIEVDLFLQEVEPEYDENEIEVDLFLQEVEPEYDENGDEIDQEREFKTFKIPIEMGFEDGMSIEEKVNASLVKKYLEEIEIGMYQLKDKGHKSSIELKKDGFYFEDINYNVKKIEESDCVVIHSKDFREMADKVLKTMAVYEVIFNQVPFSDNSDIAKVYNEFAKNVDFKDSDGIVRGVSDKLKNYNEILDNTLKNIKADGIIEGVKIFYSNNSKYKNNIRIDKDDLKFEKEIKNLTYESTRDYGLNTIQSMIVSKEYSEKYKEKCFKEKENVFKKEHNLEISEDKKYFMEKSKKINEDFKNIEVEELKDYIKAKSLEYNDSLDKSTELLDDIFGTEVSSNFKERYLYEKAKDFNLTKGQDERGNDVIVNLYNHNKVKERDIINDFFTATIKNPIQQEIVELKELGEKPKYENDKINNYLKNKDNLINELYCANWNDNFKGISLNEQVKIIEGTLNKENVFPKDDYALKKFNYILEYNNLPTISKEKFKKISDEFNPKEYNIGFNINVDEVKKKYLKNIETNNEKNNIKNNDEKEF